MKPEKRVEEERERLEGVVQRANEPEPPHADPVDPKRPSLRR
jgi:hypothetical protein